MSEADRSYSLSTLLAGMIIKPVQAMAPMSEVLNQLESFLSELDQSGKTQALAPFRLQRGEIVDFTGFRKLHGKH